MRIAYARVSTDDQSLDLQINALKKAGYDRLFQDHGVSGVAEDRPGFFEALKTLKEGDTFIVWRLDRVARSNWELTDTVMSLHRNGIRFQSLCEHIDVSSPFGELILHVLSAIAHFERGLIVERTRAGMKAAKERGVQIGRKRALNGEQFLEARFLLNEGKRVSDVAKHMGIGRSTLYRYLRGG
ncbi:MAG: recombinase family protein [Pseudomonadota bacterium]